MSEGYPEHVGHEKSVWFKENQGIDPNEEYLFYEGFMKPELKGKKYDIPPIIDSSPTFTEVTIIDHPEKGVFITKGIWRPLGYAYGKLGVTRKPGVYIALDGTFDDGE